METWCKLVRVMRKLATSGKQGCQMLLPAQNTCATAIWEASIWITFPLLLAKSPGMEEKYQTFEGYYLTISLNSRTINNALLLWSAVQCCKLSEHLPNPLHTADLALRYQLIESLRPFSKSSHCCCWNPPHMLQSTSINLPGEGRGSSIQHAWSTKWPSESKDFHCHN